MSLGLVNVTAFRVQIKEVDEDNWSGSEVVEEDLVRVCLPTAAAHLDLACGDANRRLTFTESSENPN
ncbi:hypothetical protein POTOM_043634 [Populus tomentosa]|uniref:Uncharacterized protein n=1 Tax=Populus tomentosa TaxID=118781 RepID=A0A8X8C7A3_POPTO|nr:hypothetical protein POTOM_043634 [Populus tomentosa]